jgi:hypothetical protein
LTYRDPEGSGLVTIYHPWESGTDNSPRWDTVLAAVEVSDLAPYPRYDLQHVANRSQRPTDAEYDRYVWLVKLIKKASCDERSIYGEYFDPFTGERLGANDQSWTAAVALDWLANGPRREERKVA